MKRKRNPPSHSFSKNSKLEYKTPPVKESISGIYIHGLHPVNHLLQDTDFSIQNIFIQDGLTGAEINKIQNLTKKRGLLVQNKPKSVLDHLAKNHQGIVAQVKEQSFYKPIEILKNARLVLVLDHLEDPQNLGSILRTADQFGVDAVVIPKNRSVGITSSVIKVSSGAALFVPIIQESSMLFVIEKLKEFGFWVYATSVDQGSSIHQVKFTDKVALILGNESDGVSEQLIKKSDFLLTIPSSSQKKIDSLNVAVATGILVYEIFTKK